MGHNKFIQVKTEKKTVSYKNDIEQSKQTNNIQLLGQKVTPACDEAIVTCNDPFFHSARLNSWMCGVLKLPFDAPPAC